MTCTEAKFISETEHAPWLNDLDDYYSDRFSKEDWKTVKKYIDMLDTDSEWDSYSRKITWLSDTEHWENGAKDKLFDWDETAETERMNYWEKMDYLNFHSDLRYTDIYHAIDAVGLADLDQTGERDLILHVIDGGGNYILLHRKGESIFGILMSEKEWDRQGMPDRVSLQWFGK